MDRQLIADRLSGLRKEKGYTQAEVSNILSVGYDTVQGWEYKRSVPKASVLLQLSNLYGVSIDYILGNTNKKEINK